MKKNKQSSLKIAGAYIGTVIGAGFASGQEMLRFFGVFEMKGLLGLFLVTFLFMFFGYIVMDYAYELKSESHSKVLQFCGGTFLGSILDYAITFFLFGSLTAMFAGSGAMFHQYFHLSPLWGSLFMAVVTAITVLSGLNGVVKSIGFFVPFMLTATLAISILSLFLSPLQMNYIEFSSNGLIQNWFVAAILYISYNIMLSISVLSALGANAEDKNAVKNGAILGGIGLGIGSISIFFALYHHMSTVANLEVPMLFIASRISNTMQLIYYLVLLTEVYSTSIGGLYGFITRISTEKNRKSSVILFTFTAFILSLIGFSNIVKWFYPIIGYGGILLLLSLLLSRIKEFFARLFFTR